MAFGLFLAEERAPRPVKEKVRKEPPAPKAKPTPPVKPIPQTKVPPAPPQAGRNRLQILLIGRNLSIIQEFLCSMNQNMGDALLREGMSFYTQELASISDIVAKKKRLEQFCWSFSTNDWLYPQEEEAASRTYIFSISPSGDQAKALDLVIQCITPEAGEHLSWEQTDAVWLLSDGALFYAPEDPYLRYLQSVLISLPARDGEAAKPVCLVLSQIEHLGHFDGTDDLSILPAKVVQHLSEQCRKQFSANTPVALIPVQVYGGMECTGIDEKHAPILHIGQNGFYQSYIPDNCQIPALYTVQAICSRWQADAFDGGPESSLLRGIRNHYSSKFGNPKWMPQLLAEGDGI